MGRDENGTVWSLDGEPLWRLLPRKPGGNRVVSASAFGHESMSGETDLSTLLQTLSPRLDPEHYVFCSVTGTEYGAFAHLNPRACF